MPNRIIKESICTSENVNSLSAGAEVLFYRLIVKADDFGCYHGNIKIIKSTCYPLKSDAIKDKQIFEWLNELIKAGLVFLYTADDGKQYIKLSKWEKHQQKRANKPKFPLPKSDDINCKQLQANVPVNENVNDIRESIIENDIREPVHEKTALESAIDDFKEFRKKIKKPLTPKAEQLLLSKLNNLASDDTTKIAILEQSILNGWQGVFPLKEDKQTAKHAPANKGNFEQRQYSDGDFEKLYKDV